MSDLSFDTHAEIRTLEQSGIPLPQAEALVDMVTRAPINQQVAETLEYLKFQVDTNMATKADLEALRGSTKADTEALRGSTAAGFAALRGSTEAGFAALSGSIAALSGSTEAKIATLRADLYRALWLQGGLLGTLILGLAAMILVFARYTLAGP